MIRTATSETVRIVPLLGEDSKEIRHKEGMLVRDALSEAEVNFKNKSIRLNGEPTDLDAPVPAGSTIMLVQALTGNSIMVV